MNLNTVRSRLVYRSLGWATLVALIVIWEVLGRMSNAFSTVPFSSAAVGMGRIIFSPDLVEHVLPSVGRVLIGFALASAFGIVIGVVIGSIRALDPWVNPLLEFGRAIPPPLLVPIALVVVGLGSELVILLIAFGAFWPVVINTIDGVRRIEPGYLETAAVLHVSGITRTTRVMLPAALPSVMAGLRTALSISLILMVVAEMLGSSTGIGFLVLFAEQTFDVPSTYGGVLLLALLGWVFDTVFVLFERRALSWHSSFQTEDYV